MLLNQIVAIIGMSGSGKSYLTHFILNNINKPTIIIDYKKGNEGAGEYISYIKKGYKHIPLYSEINNQLNSNDWIKIIKRHPKLIINQKGLTYEELYTFIDNLSAAVNVVGNRLLIIEETHQFAENGRVPRNLQRLITGGRSDGIDLFFIVQKPSSVDTTLLSQAHKYFIFQLVDKNCLSRLETVISKDIKDLIINLGRFKCYVKDTTNNKKYILNTKNLKTNHI